jgi:protein phosphatase 2C family protein 2/3
MEDAHTHILEMENDRSAAFFAVYDGHGGMHEIRQDLRRRS